MLIISLPALPRRRIIAIDALRGLTFFVMLFVNCLSGANGIPYGIQHMAADVDGMSLADVVFPAFLFVVGTSIPFSLNHRLAVEGGMRQTLWQVVARAFGLIVIGLFMVNTEEGYNETAMGISIQLWALCFYAAVLLVWGTRSNRLLRWFGIEVIVMLVLIYRGGPDGQGWMQTSWWGILGCIGWAYLASSVIYLAGRGRPMVLALAVVACALWFMASHALDGNAVVAMHATHTSIVLCGALCVLLFFDGARGAGGAPRLMAGTVLALALALSAWLLHHFYPISKIGATPPWALYCAALCSGLFVLLYWLIEMRQVTRWTALVQPAAANPLVTYLLPVVLATLMHYLHLRWWPVLMHGGAAIAFALLFSASIVAVVAVLNTYNIKLKL
jgi:heparan-alpha-glucosaminide N-acetyltransferase